ncbi:MAG: UbiA-like polyprenyltransferase [Planctomycetota bacterium]
MTHPSSPDAPAPAPEPPTLPQQAGALARDIKLSHTVFALPFALLGMALAAAWAQRYPSASEVVLILICMFTARTFAMGVNRLADAKLDAQNPRTAGRALPGGRVRRGFVIATIVSNALGFVAACAGFWWLRSNPCPLTWSPFVLGVLALYSFTKRFTWLCHLFLGFALAISPVAAALAIEPRFVETVPTAWLLAGMVLCWVAGFDVIYALQDVGIDRELGLFSMPASLGPEPALWISRGLHIVCLGCLASATWISPLLGMWFAVAVVITAALLIVEHALVWRSSTNRIHVAFFTVNGVISLLLGAAGILDATLTRGS